MTLDRLLWEHSHFVPTTLCGWTKPSSQAKQTWISPVQKLGSMEAWWEAGQLPSYQSVSSYFKRLYSSEDIILVRHSVILSHPFPYFLIWKLVTNVMKTDYLPLFHTLWRALTRRAVICHSPPTPRPFLFCFLSHVAPCFHKVGGVAGVAISFLFFSITAFFFFLSSHWCAAKCTGSKALNQHS